MFVVVVVLTAGFVIGSSAVAGETFCLGLVTVGASDIRSYSSSSSASSTVAAFGVEFLEKLIESCFAGVPGGASRFENHIFDREEIDWLQLYVWYSDRFLVKVRSP